MNKGRAGNGFTLVEVLCALAILFMVLIPFYQTTLHTAKLQNKVEMQFQANHLAQSEMERLMNEADIDVGQNSFTDLDPSGNMLYVETRVEALPGIPGPQPPSQPEWHLKLVFETERIIIIPVNVLTVTGRNGENLGRLYASLIGWPPGEFLCELGADSSIQFYGGGVLQLSKDKVIRQGIDLSKSGKASGDLKILCVGETTGNLNLYFNSSFPPQHKPKHIVLVDNRIQRLGTPLWPGANRNLQLKTGTLGEGRQAIQDRGYFVTVRIFDSEAGNKDRGELVKLQSIRHEIDAIE